MSYVGWLGTYEGDKTPTNVQKMNSQVVEKSLSLGAVLYCQLNLAYRCPLQR